MTDIQPAFKDPELLKIYRAVTTGPHALTPEELDRPLPTIDYNRYAPGPMTQPDGKVQARELFHALVTRPNLYSIYRRFAGEAQPWIPSKNAYNRQVFKVFDDMVREYREENPGEGKLSLGLAKKIYDWLLEERSKGGLGMEYNWGLPEMHFDDSVRAAKARCTEFTYLQLAFYSRAGFQVEPEWVGEGSRSGESILHVVVRLTLKGKHYFLDPTLEKFNGPQAGHVPMGREQLLAIYWSNRGGNTISNDKLKARQYYERALAMDPGDPVARLNLGYYYLYIKDYGKAEEEFRKVQKSYPRFWMPYEALGTLRNYQGKDEKNLKRHGEAVRFFGLGVKYNPNGVQPRKGVVRSWIGTGNKTQAQKALDSFKQFLEKRSPYLHRDEERRLRLWISAQQNIIHTL